MNDQELQAKAAEFKRSHPRWYDYGMLFTYQCLTYNGLQVSTAEFRDFLTYLTGHVFKLEFMEKQLANEKSDQEKRRL